MKEDDTLRDRTMRKRMNEAELGRVDCRTSRNPPPKLDPFTVAYAGRLTDLLADHLPWHRARLKFIARFTTALMQLITTNSPNLPWR